MSTENTIVIGFDVGGAHLKVVRAEGGRVVRAVTFATPIWQSLDTLSDAFARTAALCADADRAAFTMTGELSDVFSSREEGVRGLLAIIAAHAPVNEKLIYAGRSGIVGIEQAAGMATDVASANWHATASLIAKLAGDALFVDMGSTTTDLVPIRSGVLANRGYSDAERLATGELVYTGFTRTFLFGVASSAPVDGAFTPLMNEYFASMADVHRVLGVLDENDDKHATADGKPKTLAASTARLARMVGRDIEELSADEWRDVAAWFSEQQLRIVHDASFRLLGRLIADAPIVAAGTGRWQINRLASRLNRRCIDLAELIPADDAVRHEASNAAAAAAVALL